MKSKVIGIIGGGQLGRMMAISAKQMGHKIIVLDPQNGCPASQVADKHLVYNYGDLNGIEHLCKECDVVTYEFENIPYEPIKTLEKKFNIIGGYLPLYLAQNRYREKSAVDKLGIPLAKFKYVKNEKELIEAIKEINMPAVLKTCEGGYDGKGQVIINNESKMKEAIELVKKKECVLEEFISFNKEISVVATRSIGGEITTLPIPENIHKENILHMSILPSDISEKLIQKGVKYIEKIMNEFNIVGTLCVEFFVKDELLLFNEMAPRPHNSGHYSIEGCITSQFEQHIRAILGYKLGSTKLRQPTIMVNVLGQHMRGISKLLESEEHLNCKVHLYGKSEAKHNRKMGHVTFIDMTKEEVDSIVTKYWDIAN